MTVYEYKMHLVFSKWETPDRDELAKGLTELSAQGWIPVTWTHKTVDRPERDASRGYWEILCKRPKN